MRNRMRDRSRKAGGTSWMTCVVCGAPPWGHHSCSGTGAVVVQCMRGPPPPPSAGSMHNHPCVGTSAAARLSCSAVGPCPCTTLGTCRLPCATPRPTTGSHDGGRPACDIGGELPQPGLIAVLRRCPVRCKQAGEPGQTQPLPQHLEGAAAPMLGGHHPGTGLRCWAALPLPSWWWPNMPLLQLPRVSG